MSDIEIVLTDLRKYSGHKNFICLAYEALGKQQRERLNTKYLEWGRYEKQVNINPPINFELLPKTGTAYFIATIIEACNKLEKHQPIPYKSSEAKAYQTRKKHVFEDEKYQGYVDKIKDQLKNGDLQLSKRKSSIQKHISKVEKILNTPYLAMIIKNNISSMFLISWKNLCHEITTYLNSKLENQEKLQNLLEQLDEFKNNLDSILTYTRQMELTSPTLYKTQQFIMLVATDLYYMFGISIPKAQQDNGNASQFCRTLMCAAQFISCTVEEVQLAMNQMYEAHKKRIQREMPTYIGDILIPKKQILSQMENKKLPFNYGLKSNLREILAQDLILTN